MTAPQDRQKAIVEAAERISRAVDLLAPRVDAGDQTFELRSAFESLSAALALPEPEWTRDVPTEPGRYWYREWIEAQTYPNAGRPVTFEARWLVDIEDVTEKHLDPTWVLDAPAQWAKARREWWPVPISAPPSTGPKG